MSYTALYRKLRPIIFEDVIGQEHIVRTLKNQITTNRISHAYLFCGTRGTGKTSTAKIFAKAINCFDSKSAEPCGECLSCLNIQEQRSMNVIEIDAASNNGVDNIRDIREEVKYPPTEGKYKIYIIDEVHMLSIGAFNALLKTLEEPPQHVIFILATTDPQKIPPTILSRCQRFDFKRITAELMSNAIKKYMGQEEINITDDALNYISYLSDGAMRDALSLLDQCIAFYYEETITIDKVQEIAGSVDKQVFYDLTEALCNFNSLNCLNIIEDIVIKGRDISQFVSELVNHFRNILIVKSLNDNSNLLDISIENIETIKSIAKEIDSSVLINFINVFSNLQSSLKYATNPRISLEVTCIKICNPETQENYASLFSRMKKLENIISSGSFVNSKPKEIENKENILPVEIKEKAVPEDIEKVIQNFMSFAKTFQDPLNSMLAISFGGYLESHILYIVSNSQSISDYFKKCNDLINEKLVAKFNKEFSVEYISKAEYDIKHKRLFGLVDQLSEEFDTQDISNKIDFDIIQR